MSALGRLLGGSFLQVAFHRLVTPEFMDFVRWWKIDLEEVESLEETSAEIQALSDEAEVKQFSNKRVKLWLDRLKQHLYDAEDILDEFATEVLRLKLESEYQTHPHQTQQVYNIIEELQGKVRDINDRLKSVAQKGVALGLNPGMGSGSSRPGVFIQRTQTSSLVIQSNVFGREEDMWKIVGWLLSDKTPSHSHNGNNFSVLPIVGMGGSGKTTLAQLVYNHENLGNHFGLKAWVCVSENFDVLRLTKEILESATGSSSPNSESLDLLQRKLKETLSNKRFLLVLDDMWNEKYESWDALRTAFAFGKPGSKILVTTRNKGVALMVHTDPDDQDHDIEGLSDEACIALVRRHAFRDENSDDANQKLEVFGEEIVKKCRGLPLAVKTLAGLLRGKRDNNDWKDILENEIWDIRESEILPSLMLSYHHLPPLLKRCFAYCALFPKDHVFNKIEFVMLWMAEGFVQPKGTKRLEDIGGGYFDELFMRSFFELSNRPLSDKALVPFVWQGGYGVEELFYKLSEKHHTKSFFESSNTDMESGFVMHDMIHDLAQYASRGIYCRREDDKPSEVLATIRHLSYFTKNYNIEARELEAMKSLRTLRHAENLLISFDYSKQFFTTLQFQFQSLRVLCLRGYRNCELPDSIGKLKHLRFLDLSFSRIEELPNSITSLYNLQTLLLVDCQSLRELPKDMGNLLNLRHLFLPTHTWLNYSRVSHMPLGVGKLTSLQTLSTFVVGSKNIMEMRHLSQLRGTLVISNLENVGNNGAEAMVANLKNKPHLLGLRLRWSYNRTSNDEKVEEDVLEQLQPHIKLEALWIEEYSGTGFPSWMGHPSFSNLKTVSLLGFRKCRFLPHLMQLPLLKHLEINNCSAKKMVGSESYGEGSSSASKQFQSLEKLCITNMKEWEEWPDVVGQEEEGGGQFPCLRELSIRYCPKLRMFSHCFPALVILKIRYCEDLRELPQILPKLQELVIYDCPKLVILPSLPCIENLTLYCCEQIATLSNSDHPSSFSSSSAAAPPPPPSVHNSFHCLHKLHIKCCLNLRELASVLPSLESLHIEDCKELCFLPNVPSIKELILKKCKGIVLNNKTMPHLSSLSSLTIDDMSDLESLPNGFIKHLTTLQKLKISHCTELTVLLKDEIGFDHLLPSSLQYLSIKDCDNLRMLLQTMCNLHCLDELIITGAKGLASLPEGLDNLTSLRVLEISNCENLESLPKELHNLISLQRFKIKSLSAHVSFQETRLPTTLQELRIIDCQNLEPLSKDLHTLTSLRRFEIESLPALMSFQEIRLPTALQELRIVDCQNLESLPKELHTLTSLQQFTIESLPVLISFQKLGLPIALQKLSIVDCKNLESLPRKLHTLTSLQRFTIRSCHALVSFQETMLPTALQGLSIIDCKNLESLPRELHTLTSLQRFTIERCHALISFQETGLPIALQQLSIVDCKNLESLPRELHTLTSLQQFTIESCHALVSFQETMLPTGLEGLRIIDCKNLELLPMGLVYNNLTSLRSLVLHGYPNPKSLLEGLHKLTYLQRLEIKECLALESFPDMGLRNGLQHLLISNCGKLRSLPKGLHKLTNLESLEIKECQFLTECKNLEPLRISGLHNLTTLRDLRIGECPALLSIPEGLLPTYLRVFCIENCPILEALHYGLSDLFSLECLSIRNCPMLTQRYQKKEGKEWFKIAHIPYAVIDGKRQ